MYNQPTTNKTKEKTTKTKNKQQKSDFVSVRTKVSTQAE